MQNLKVNRNKTWVKAGHKIKEKKKYNTNFIHSTALCDIFLAVFFSCIKNKIQKNVRKMRESCTQTTVKAIKVPKAVELFDGFIFSI